MRSAVSYLALAMVVLLGAPAFAASKTSKQKKTDATTEDSRERDARKACLEGNYQTGVAILNEMFLDTKSPTHIFNQGRCYEQNERYTEAINRFREYLRMTNEFADVVQKHINECQTLDKQKHPESSASAAAPQPDASKAESLPAVNVTSTPVQNQPESSSGSGSGWRMAGLITAGAGAAFFCTGIALNVKANSLASQVKPPRTYERSTESTRRTYETLSWVGYGVGAVAIATGATLYGIGWSKAKGPEALALRPVVAPGCAGAILEGAF